MISNVLARSLLIVGVLAAGAATSPLRAQRGGRGSATVDTVPKGVNLGLVYRQGQTTGLMVLPIVGPSGDSLTAIVSRDLKYSDRFSITEPSSVTVAAGPLNYALFSKLGVDGVIQGTLLPSGWLRISLHDVASKSVKNQKDFPLPSPAGSPAWRLAVHGVSDGIEEWITGQRGIAQTRIAFTRSGRVWIVDSDGANVTAVTQSGMSPAWMPSGRGLVYSQVEGGPAPIMAVDLATGAKRVVILENNAQNVSPTVTPDGKTVAYAHISENGTDIYTVPVGGGTPMRVTVGRGRASVQPTFSPDGQRMAFSSDRSGYSDVYISDVDGTNVEVLSGSTFGDRNNRTGPDWSPDGRLVAFQSLNQNSKTIMTINIRDHSLRAVATDGRNDDPSWAPDSRHLVFTSDRSGVRQLWVVDIETGTTRQLTRGPETRLAAWSPRLLVP